jgi:hypothetical protein
VSHRIFSLLSALVVLLCLGTFAPTVHADEGEADRFRAALEQFHARNYSAALPVFQQIVDRTGSPNARLYLARSLRALGRVAEAYEQMSITRRDATAKAETEERYVGTRDASAAELAALEPRVGQVLVVFVEQLTHPKVTINGVELASERIGQPVAVMPGNVTVVASTASGEAAITRRLTINGGQLETLTMSFPQSEGANAAPASEAPEPDGAEDESATTGGELRIVGYGVVGLGVAGMVMFGVAGAMANDKFDSVTEACGSRRCTDPAFADDIDSGKTLDTLTNVGLVVGLLGLSAGAALIVFGGPTDADTQQALRVEIAPNGLRVGGSF